VCVCYKFLLSKNKVTNDVNFTRKNSRWLITMINRYINALWTLRRFGLLILLLWLWHKYGIYFISWSVWLYVDMSCIQQLQPSRGCWDGVLAFRCIWSGKSLYWSCCSSCASALRAASWNACSTLIASFALDSNDAMLPFRLHHWCSCFVVT